MRGPLKNDEGQLSGAKLVLLASSGVALGWLLRDLFFDRALSDGHVALMAALLVIGLLNRISARGHFKVRLGRDGAEFETRGKHDQV